MTAVNAVLTAPGLPQPGSLAVAVAGSPGPPAATVLAPLELPRLRAVARHALPNLVEATLIPSALFYVCLRIFGVWPALIVALSWAYAALIRRAVTGRRISGLLMLAVLGLTVRTGVAFGSGSTFVYFMQPIIATTVVGVVFLLSALAGRPLVNRLAGDFCPLPAGITDRRRIQRLFNHLSVLWGAVNVLNAGVALWLFTTQPLPVFVAVKTVSAMAVTWSAVLITVALSMRAARLEGLRLARVNRFTRARR
jgi:hypothetical protein